MYDETAGTCDAVKEVPGSIAVSLTDGDGVALAGGACVTAADGVSTCTFDKLASGEARTVVFQNTSSMSTIQVTAADEAGAPAPLVTETVQDGYEPAEGVVAEQPQVSLHEAVGGTVVRVIRAPGDALRLLARDPKSFEGVCGRLGTVVAAGELGEATAGGGDLVQRSPTVILIVRPAAVTSNW